MKTKDLVQENVKLRNQNTDLRIALANIIADWDSTMRGDIEQEKEMNMNGVIHKYWSPAGSIIKSEFIAAARKVLSNGQPKK